MIRLRRDVDITEEICRFLHATLGPEDFAYWWDDYSLSNNTGDVIFLEYKWKLTARLNVLEIEAPPEVETFLVLKYGIADD